MKYTDGSFYEGEFRYRLKHGNGKLTNADGTYHEGLFKDDKIYHGKGAMKYADGSVYEG